MKINCTPAIAFGLASAAGLAMAQPPANQLPPTTTPPPQAPPANWAPPLPQEAPPPPPSQGAQPPSQGAPPPQEAPPAEAAPVSPVDTQLSRAAEEAEAEKLPKSSFEIYGFVMTDTGFDFGQIGNPAWQDTMRPTKLPAFHDEFGKGTRTFAGVRQSRFGVKSTTPTRYADLKTTFEWELFGVGVDEGQTTFRLRHAYADWGQLRAGQTWSPFMDIDVFPNSIEYWGPNGMVFFRNVQVAWMPIQGESRVTVALERPGASADTSTIEDLALANVVGRFPMPDISAEGRYGGDWGYVEAAGIVRWIKWDDLDPLTTAIEGNAWGWGINLSSNLKIDPTIIRLQAVYGAGIENYMNDAGADIGPELTANPMAPDGNALPVLGLVAFVDVNWSKIWTSTAGWSFVWVDNSDGQAPDAFHMGHYALANLLWHPTDKIMMGGEFQYGRRVNNSDDFAVNDFKLQFSFKFSYSKLFGGD